MCGDYNLRREKRYVEVDVRFTPDGKIYWLTCFRTTTEKQSSAVGTLPIGNETDSPHGKNGRRIPLQRSC